MNKTPLTYIDGETLLTTVLPPVRSVVSGLLSQGLHVLAGAPKAGKSWLALHLCLCVAKGKPIWELPVTKGGALYLCLEDSYSRIQNRLLDITDSAPANLFFSTISEKLRSGLEEQIEEFLTQHPDTNLVVIDTLQRVRLVANDVNPYANDYRDLGVLKKLTHVSEWSVCGNCFMNCPRKSGIFLGNVSAPSDTQRRRCVGSLCTT